MNETERERESETLFGGKRLERQRERERERESLGEWRSERTRRRKSIRQNERNYVALKFERIDKDVSCSASEWSFYSICTCTDSKCRYDNECCESWKYVEP